jgi:hypothetical protein
MRYTVWSHGQLAGESDLSFASGDDNVRHGQFIPSEKGAALMPVLTAVPAAAMALARAAKRIASDGASRYERLTEYADMMAAIDRREALGLELRDDTGRTIETEWIDIRDIDVLLSLDDDPDDSEYESFDDDPELEAAIEHDARIIAEWFEKGENEGASYSTLDFDPDLELDDLCGPVEPWKERIDRPEHHWYQITVRLPGGDRLMARRAKGRST